MPETVACPRCTRNNGAHRTSCIYCGEPLPIVDEALQVPTLRPVEEWESGFNVVLAPLDVEPTEAQALRLAEVTRMEEDVARAVLDARASLPVARVPSEAEAALVARLLGASDLAAVVVPDAALAPERMARRVREIELAEDRLRLLVLWGDWVSIPRAEVRLAVEGRLVSRKTDIYETVGKRRDRQRDLVETAEFTSERYTVDVYGPTLEASYRIKAESFDFTCLGIRPAPYLEANVKALAGALAEYLGASRYDASFHRVARLLEHAWPAVSRVSSRGLARRADDIRKLTASSVEIDALPQFTRYSRLRYALAGGEGG